MPKLEKKILRLSVIVLFLSLLVVYVLFYQVKGSLIKDVLTSNADVEIDNDIKIYIKTGDKKEVVEEIIKDFGSGNVDIVFSWKLSESIGINKKENEIVETQSISGQNDIRYLSWTKLFYGILESVEKLWLSYKYILQDDNSIYYIYLWDLKYDIVNIARKLWGNIYTINTEQEILKNMLFGDKIIFINLPEYKNSIVLMILYIDEDVWLLQIDYDVYHKSKNYLKSLFID